MTTEFKLPTLKEFMERKFPPRDWGGWRRKGSVLYFPKNKRTLYDLDLASFTSSAKLLDMIIQVSNKTWATDACLAGLVRAAGEILHPQECLCSFGADKRLTKQQINDRIKACERTE